MKKSIKNTVFLLLFIGCSVFTSAQQSDTLRVVSKSDTIQVVDTLKKFVPIKNSQQVDQIITYAKKFLGTPYRYAGSTPSGFDCSGFISYIFGNFGFSLGHSSYGMAEFGKTVKLADIRPGDLLFFKGSSVNSSRIGHVAMVVDVKEDGIYFIHSASSRGVVIENFRNNRYFIARYVTAKRLDYGVIEK